VTSPSELSGKRALITGGSGGIGAAIARELARLGVHLVLTARGRDALDAVAGECRALGVDVETLVADLGEPGAAAALWTAARAKPVDILINNAGFGYFRPFQGVEWARDAELLQLNITSLVELSRRFVDDQVGATTGAAYLVNISSIGAYQSVPNMAVYASSKAFVRNFTEALHDELRHTHVRVTCVCPGGTKTNFHAAAGAGNYSWLANASMMSAETVAQIAVAAMRKNQRTVVPGVLNKLAAWSIRLLSRRLAAWSASRVLGKPRAAALPARKPG
jgi:short-subunit dehydrogenase